MNVCQHLCREWLNALLGMKRRQTLRNLGVVLTGIATVSTTASGTGSQRPRFNEGGAREEPPSRNVDTVQVGPFPGNPTVPTGDWIDHTFVVVSSEGATKDQFTDDVLSTLRVWVGNEEIDDPQQYLDDPVRGDDDRLRADWDFVTPPKPPRQYLFKTSILGPNGPTVQAPYQVDPNQQ
jgi:hypothetical protein